MKEVFDFLAKAGPYFLATADGDQPHVRPVGFMMEYDGKLVLCSDNTKQVYRQLQANPKMSLACYDGKGNTLRICGKAVFITSDEVQKKALEVMPDLGNIYAVGDGLFELYYIDEGKAILSDMQGGRKEIKF